MHASTESRPAGTQRCIARLSLVLLACVAGLQTGVAPAGAQEPIPPVSGAEVPSAQACRSLPALDSPPVIAPPPAIRPESDPGDYWLSLHAFDPPVSLGVGHLRVTSDHYDWLRDVSIPLFVRPDPTDVPIAWLRGGWLDSNDPDGPRRRIGYRGMIETEYERATAIVLERRPDGWFRFRYDLPPEARPDDSIAASITGGEDANWLPTDDGTAWVHECHLDLGEARLTVQLWRDLFFGPDAPALSFLDQAPQPLRDAPYPEANRTAWVERDDEVEALEIRGEWMRVRVSSPGKYLTFCIGTDEWDGEMFEGWVRWWDPQDGPRLWYPTRGC